MSSLFPSRNEKFVIGITLLISLAVDTYIGRIKR